MKQDIITPEVKDIIVAVVPRDNGADEQLWDTYIVNLREEPMESVLITSQGYGEIDGRDKTTTVLRHFHQIIMPNSFLKVEPIQEALFGLKNEYWISFNDGDVMLDKRYVFQPGEINEEALKTVPVLDRPGVMLQ
ncbi:MAG: hypothetical protein AB8H12_22705 [Lewinella sp.]